ncbi:MAG: hypothetical protein JSV88_12615, partial [Candidatus Aminicenantes bacterium]
VIGIFIDIMLSRKRISALHRCLNVCEKVVYDQIDKTIISPIIDHFREELNRILEILVREISTRMGKAKSSGSFNIRNLEVKNLELDFMNSSRAIKRTNLFIGKLESAARRIKFFRWVFGILLTIVLLLGFFLIVWPKLVPPWTSITALIISILSFIVFVFDCIKTNDLIDNTEKEYGLSIGE